MSAEWTDKIDDLASATYREKYWQPGLPSWENAPAPQRRAIVAKIAETVESDNLVYALLSLLNEWEHGESSISDVEPGIAYCAQWLRKTLAENRPDVLAQYDRRRGVYWERSDV